jgi:hypothetical protein
MAKKSGLIENNVEETTPSANVSVEETATVETPKTETQAQGHPSRDFHTPING